MLQMSRQLVDENQAGGCVWGNRSKDNKAREKREKVSIFFKSRVNECEATAVQPHLTLNAKSTTS